MQRPRACEIHRNDRLPVIEVCRDTRKEARAQGVSARLWPGPFRLRPGATGRVAWLVMSAYLLTGCANLATRSSWAATEAAADPWTWSPLVVGLSLGATGADERVSRWAMENTPLFGSRESASDASDRLRYATRYLSWGTTLAASARYEKHWAKETAIDVASGFAGIVLARNVTGALKREVQRDRPDEFNDESFVSAHATDAMAHASLGRYYARRLESPEALRTTAGWAVSLTGIATAWARVEAGNHYPTDVLASAALANFTTRFFILVAETDDVCRVSAGPLPGWNGVFVQATSRF